MVTERDLERQKCCKEVSEILVDYPKGLAFHEIYVRTHGYVEDVVSTLVAMAELGILDCYVKAGTVYYRRKDYNE